MSWTNYHAILLIEGYKRYPLLYMVKDPEYHNKHKRKIALEQILLDISRPNTKISDIQKKWNGLRCTYKVERRKHLDSMKCGAGEDDIYIPSLWYYDHINFIDDQLVNRTSVSNFSIIPSTSTKLEIEIDENEYDMHVDGLISTIDTPSPSLQSFSVDYDESKSSLQFPVHSKRRKLSTGEQISEKSLDSIVSVLGKPSAEANPGIDVKRFKCKLCKRKYLTKGLLYRHKRTHIGRNGFKCEICKKSFTLKATLHQHIKSHFDCEMCDKKFTAVSDLNRHLQTNRHKQLETIELHKQIANSLKNNLSTSSNVTVKCEINEEIKDIKIELLDEELNQMDEANCDYSVNLSTSSNVTVKCEIKEEMKDIKIELLDEELNQMEEANCDYSVNLSTSSNVTVKCEIKEEMKDSKIELLDEELKQMEEANCDYSVNLINIKLEHSNINKES